MLAAMTWWRRNRERAPLVLEHELKVALEKIAATPWIGASVPDSEVPGMRRIALLRTRYILFFRVDEPKNEVTVLRLWRASRGGLPRP